MKKAIGPQTLLYPMPAVLLAGGWAEPCLWGRLVGSKPEGRSTKRGARSPKPPNPEPILKFSSNWF